MSRSAGLAPSAAEVTAHQIAFTEREGMRRTPRVSVIVVLRLRPHAAERERRRCGTTLSSGAKPKQRDLCHRPPPPPLWTRATLMPMRRRLQHRRTQHSIPTRARGASDVARQRSAAFERGDIKPKQKIPAPFRYSCSTISPLPPPHLPNHHHHAPHTSPPHHHHHHHHHHPPRTCMLARLHNVIECRVARV